MNSYELGEAQPFNTFTLTKTENNDGHGKPGFFTSLKDGFVRAVGAVYTAFNNISVLSDLKEKNYEVKLSDFFGEQ